MSPNTKDVKHRQTEILRPNIYTILTDSGLVTPYGLVVRGIYLGDVAAISKACKPSPEAMLISSSKSSGVFSWDQFQRIAHKSSIYKLSLKITLWKLLPHLPGANDSDSLTHPSAAYMRQRTGSALLQIMACRLVGAKPLSKPMLEYCQLDP